MPDAARSPALCAHANDGVGRTIGYSSDPVAQGKFERLMLPPATGSRSAPSAYSDELNGVIDIGKPMLG